MRQREPQPLLNTARHGREQVHLRVASRKDCLHNVSMSSTAKLYRDSRRAAAWGIALSLCLGLVKFVGGFFGHSLALVSDAVHSLVDAAISGALLGALLLAERPADPEHPYGHGRWELVAGAGVAIALLVVAAGIAWEAITTIYEPHEPPHTYTLVIAAGGALFQEGVHRYASRVARQSGSGALAATAWDYRLDALGALAVVLGVSFSKWGGPSWQSADRVAALVISATVLWIGGRLLRENINDLMDRQAPAKVLAQIRHAASIVPGVLGVETLRVRKSGLEYLVDIHIEVAADLTVEVGHEIAHAVKDRIRENVPAIRDVLVHVEPHYRSSAAMPQC
jgi:cation diffusion facilitator family transporter